MLKRIEGPSGVALVRIWPSLLLILCVNLAGGSQICAQRRKPAPAAEAAKDGAYVKLTLAKGGGTGYLLEADGKGADVDSTPGLLVVLHGHGGNPKNMMRPRLASRRGDFMLSVQGGSAAGNGGFAWSGGDVKVITDLVCWTLSNRKIDPKRVVVIGHSAGGTMALRSYTAAPELFFGVISVAAPMAPTSKHRKGRVCCFYGTEDPNLSVAQAVRSVLGGKRKWQSGCLFVIDGAGHNNLPDLSYFDLAVSWCLEKKARGAEVRLPMKPPRRPEGQIRHLLVSYKGVEGYAPRQGKPRKKSKARKLAVSIGKAISRKRAYFPLEAQAWSDEASSAPLGGLVTKKHLEALDTRLAAACDSLAPDKPSKTIETARGFHLLMLVIGRP